MKSKSLSIALAGFVICFFSIYAIELGAQATICLAIICMLTVSVATVYLYTTPPRHDEISLESEIEARGLDHVSTHGKND